MSASDGDGELAATLYERIEESLASLTRSGEPVTITLHDRSVPTSNTPAAESGAEVGDEPETTGTSAFTEQVTDPGEETGPAAA